jgi:hypothetical protein
MPDLSRRFAQVVYEFLEGTKELNEVTALARDSIHLMRFLPNLVRLVEQVEPEQAANLDREKIAGILDRVKREVDSGFRHLFQQATISLWSLYEVALDRFIVGWIDEVGSAAFGDSDQVKKWTIRIPVTEAMDWWSEKDRVEFAEEVAAELRRNTGLTSGGNPKGFENLLELVSIKPPRDPDRRRTIRELWAVRNLFVHRGRKADARFLQQYPGGDFSLGDEVSVDHMKFIRFHHATVDEVATVGDEAERVFQEIIDDETRRSL